MTRKFLQDHINSLNLSFGHKNLVNTKIETSYNTKNKAIRSLKHAVTH